MLEKKKKKKKNTLRFNCLWVKRLVEVVLVEDDDRFYLIHCYENHFDVEDYSMMMVVVDVCDDYCHFAVEMKEVVDDDDSPLKKTRISPILIPSNSYFTLIIIRLIIIWIKSIGLGWRMRILIMITGIISIEIASLC